MNCCHSVSRELVHRVKGIFGNPLLLSFFHLRLIVVLRFVVNFSTIVEQLINNSSQTTVVSFCLHSRSRKKMANLCVYLLNLFFSNS